MEKEPASERKSGRLAIWLIVYALALAFILSISNLNAINERLYALLRILRPLTIGLVLAYLCNPFFRFYERRVCCRLRPPSLRRPLALTMTYLSVLLIFVILFLLIVPQLLDSIQSFLANYEIYLNSFVNFANRVFAFFNSIASRFSANAVLFKPLDVQQIKIAVLEWIKNFNFKSDAFTSNNFLLIFNAVSSTLAFVADFLIGFFISLYLLATKEKRYAQVMKARRALFSDRVNSVLTNFFTAADRSFGRFIEGKLIDSLIVGILLYIIISIFRVPYAGMIAAIVAITDIVPIIGPFIGTIPSAVIILLTDPSKLIPFLIIVVIVQQIDGNIIAPKILGDNTGVSSLCVMIAITTFGTLWGLVGAVLGVPIFATVLELTDGYVVAKLQRKGLPSGIENYYAPDALVTPSSEVSSDQGRFVSAVVRRAFHLQSRMNRDPKAKLSVSDRICRWLYKRISHMGIVTDLSDETYAELALEEAILNATSESERLYEAEQTTQSEDREPIGEQSSET